MWNYALVIYSCQHVTYTTRARGTDPAYTSQNCGVLKASAGDTLNNVKLLPSAGGAVAGIGGAGSVDPDSLCLCACARADSGYLQQRNQCQVQELILLNQINA